MMKTPNAERQARLKQARNEKGQKQVYLWLGDSEAIELKNRFPGVRGGINWRAVIDAALGQEGKI